jgi:DNA-binding NtrC family response regulator
MSIKGITVFTFTDPLLALEHFQMNDRTYVLVISDFRMPGLNGMELLKKMKDMNKFVRTILMTALDIDDNIFQNFTKRKIVNALVQKPTKLFDLTKDVDTQLHSFEMLKRYRSQ